MNANDQKLIVTLALAAALADGREDPREAEAQRKLEASGRPYCAPKAACGPGPDGTFAGTAGRCTKGACGCDPAAPLYKNCLGE